MNRMEQGFTDERVAYLDDKYNTSIVGRTKWIDYSWRLGGNQTLLLNCPSGPEERLYREMVLQRIEEASE